MMRLRKAHAMAMAVLALAVALSLPAQSPPPAKRPPQSRQFDMTPAVAWQATAPAAKAPGKARAKAPVEKPATPRASVSRRDPFEPLVGKERSGGGSPERLPPGKAGLVVSTLRLDGIVRAPNGMIAVVSNPQQRVYFLRDGDQLYDGRVERITMDAVSFNETGKDAFGKPVDRTVTKRLYPSPGEQR